MDQIVLVAEPNRWETPELAAEVRSILDAIDAPPADDRVIFEFQKTLYRGRMFGVDVAARSSWRAGVSWNLQVRMHSPNRSCRLFCPRHAQRNLQIAVSSS